MLHSVERRTFWKAGIASEARRPMITTTTMISISVKPSDRLRRRRARERVEGFME
jgi:hypothetical protein